MSLGDAILGLFARGDAPEATWLDGGSRARGMFGAFSDVTIEGDDLGLLDEVEQSWRRDPEQVWMGWLTYEIGAASVLGRAPRTGTLAGVCLRRYPGALELRADRTIGHGNPAALADLRGALAKRIDAPRPSWPWGPLRAQLDPEAYRTRVRRALAHIAAGDTYQVNLAQVFDAPWQAEPVDLPRAIAAAYADLRMRSPAPMGALVQQASRGLWILSNSPETLLDVRFGAAKGGGDRIRSWPIKGTRPRGDGQVQDAALADELRTSAKDAAEHLMIVDLVRNDLGCVATAGTVATTALPQLVSLPTVHHLVTEVGATLRPGISLRELALAVFPGGSITGAPKRRTIEIIDALEPEPREIYCGALVLLEPGGLHMSIAIRTATVDASGLRVPAGGGIVADSDPEAERLETIAKTRAFDPCRP